MDKACLIRLEGRAALSYLLLRLRDNGVLNPPGVLFDRLARYLYVVVVYETYRASASVDRAFYESSVVEHIQDRG
jgi:hypothetical protein